MDFSDALVRVHFEIMDVQNCEVAPYNIVDSIAEISLDPLPFLPDLPEYTLWKVATPWQEFETSTRPPDWADSFAGWGRVLEVDENDLTLRLSRDFAWATKGLDFSFKNLHGGSRKTPGSGHFPAYPLENSSVDASHWTARSDDVNSE